MPYTHFCFSSLKRGMVVFERLCPACAVQHVTNGLLNERMELSFNSKGSLELFFIMSVVSYVHSLLSSTSSSCIKMSYCRMYL